MRSSIIGAAVITLALPLAAPAQDRAAIRFQGMDANRDGVITREEWRGSERAFRNNDWNGDGLLSGDEVRPGAARNNRWAENDRAADDRFAALDRNGDGRVARDEWRGSRAVFEALDGNRDGVLTRVEAIGTAPTSGRRDEFDQADVNGDGVVSRSEWQWNRDAFDRLDANHDARLSRQEWRNEPPAAAASEETPAYRAGYDRGRQDGVQAGREDKPRHWDLEGQRELETADAGYQPVVGPRAEYQAGYRAGFRRGYTDGFGR